MNNDCEDAEAKRLYDNARQDWRRIHDMKMEMAIILRDACSQACYQRGIHLDGRQCEELQILLERFL